MGYSMPGFPVLHHLPQLVQTHVHQVGDVMQPSCLLSFPSPASGSFLISQIYASSHRGIEASASVLSLNIQDWFPWGLTGLVRLQSNGLSRVFSNTTVQMYLVLWHSDCCMVQLSHLYMTSGKPIALTMRTFVGKIMYLLFNMLSRFVIAFLSRSKHLLISWPQSPSAAILEPKKIKSLSVSIVSPSVCHEVMGLEAMILERHRDIDIYLKYEVLSCMLVFIYFSIIWILFSIIASSNWRRSWWGQWTGSVKVWF